MFILNFTFSGQIWHGSFGSFGKDDYLFGGQIK